MKQQISWGIMFTIAIILIVAGFEGSVGRLIGCIVTPSNVIENKTGG